MKPIYVKFEANVKFEDNQYAMAITAPDGKAAYCIIASTFNDPKIAVTYAGEHGAITLRSHKVAGKQPYIECMLQRHCRTTHQIFLRYAHELAEPNAWYDQAVNYCSGANTEPPTAQSTWDPELDNFTENETQETKEEVNSG